MFLFLRVALVVVVLGIVNAVVTCAVADDQPERTIAERSSANLSEIIGRIETLGGAVLRDETQPDSPVVGVNLSRSLKLMDEDLQLLKSFSNLRSVMLNNTGTSDAGVKHLAGLKQLTTLGLNGTKITDAGLKELVGLQNLEVIVLAGTAITDAGLNELAKLKNLKRVGLAGNLTTEAGLKEFSEALPNMQLARGRGNIVRSANPDTVRRPNANVPVARPDPEKIAGNPSEIITWIEAMGGRVDRDSQPYNRILSVNLSNCEQLKDDDLQFFSSLSSLQTLMLTGTSISDAGLKHLSELKSLTDLGLNGTKITDAGLKELAGLQNLQSIRIVGTAVTDAGLKELAKHKSLTWIGLAGTQITEAGLKELSEALPDLQHNGGASGRGNAVRGTFGGGLRRAKPGVPVVRPDPQKLVGNPSEIIALIEALGGTVGRDGTQPDSPVTEVNLSGCEQLKDEDLQYLKSFSSLRVLQLSQTGTSDTGLKNLSELTHLTDLGLIDTKITDAGLKELVGLQNLERIWLGGTAITDAGLKELAKLKDLKSVGLLGTPTTDAGLKEFSDALPNMRHNRGTGGGGTFGGSAQRVGPNASVAQSGNTEKPPSAVVDTSDRSVAKNSNRYRTLTIVANVIVLLSIATVYFVRGRFQSQE